MTQSALKTTSKPSTTPMMEQYLAIKEDHQDHLLFYQMGDFFELFFDDALAASKALDIALTKRGKQDGEDIPMCGVPAHSRDGYLHKLIKSGFKVAVCEQMESPVEAKKRGYKAVVKREVRRIVTPGTLTEDGLLESTSSNFLAAVSTIRDKLAIAWLDISTGEFSVASTDTPSLTSELSRINPKELLIPQKLFEDHNFSVLLDNYKKITTPLAASLFDSVKGEEKLKGYYGVSSLTPYGEFSRAELGSCGALLEYVELTQKGNLPRLSPPGKFTTQNFMAIDASTRRNLELSQTLSGEYKGSLFSIISKTVTAAGTRLLHKYLSAPLLNKNVIDNRLDMVEFFVANHDLRSQVHDALEMTPDMERALGRLCMSRGNPRDLAAIRDGIAQALAVSQVLELDTKCEIPAGITSCLEKLGTHDNLLIELKKALVESPGHMARDGGFIRSGYNPKLDDYRTTHQRSDGLKTALRDKYRNESEITTLRIKENNVLGFFIEVTPQHTDKVPDYFTHRQTLAGVVRYTTPELRDLENKIINARGYALNLELEIFEKLRRLVAEKNSEISLASQGLAKLDVISSLATLAVEDNYSRPVINDNTDFDISGGRHPIVEKNTSEAFIPNSCDLSDKQRLWLLTGPNMAGKSTFLRQNALISILAQIGSFVPAESAKIGLVDRVFSRVGAADDLARGQSTFMVEMVETATILNQATEKSLVILDEIGRGTATFDGLSIAWAVVEHIHNVNKCRTLFATHYHELTALSAKLDSLACYTMKVQEWEEDVIFMHEVISGVAGRSYGIHVGKLAGLPPSVITRSEEILKTLQEGESGNAVTKLAEDLPLFLNAEVKHNEKPDKITSTLKNQNIDDLSPREALDFLYELKKTMV